jgi:hypothetical protein
MGQVGGKRPGAGRKPGAVSKAKRELAEMAKDKAERALEVLAEIMERGESDAARVSAATAILDRGYGKPFQAVHHAGHDGGPGPIAAVRYEVIDPPKRE